MAPTILDVLVKPNPDLDSSWIPVNEWRMWEDFTYDNLLSIYNKVLHASWSTAPSIDMASGYDIEIWDEHTLDLFLARFMFPVVNGALARASEVLKLDEVFYLGPGSWAGSMDWALVSRNRVDEGCYSSLLPGDTKLSAKWQPKMEKSPDVRVRYQWSLPLSQATTYSVHSGCRYGFIITDKHLVLIRISIERVSEGLATSRPSRQSSSHQRIISAETDISSGLDAMSLDSFGAHSYLDDNPMNPEYQPPEYVVVPWGSHGAGRLTVKMSLFCLCLMAGCGDVAFSTDYPPLDSWRQEARRLFRHNTSGLVAKHLPKGATLEDPRVTASPYEDQSQEQGYADEGQDALEGDEEGGEGGDAAIPEADEELAVGEQQRLIQADASIGSSSSSKGKKVVYQVQLKVKDGHVYFRDFRGERRWTTRTDWTGGGVLDIAASSVSGRLTGTEVQNGMVSGSVYILSSLTTFTMDFSLATPADRQNPCHQTSEQAVPLSLSTPADQNSSHQTSEHAVPLSRNQEKQRQAKIRKRRETILVNLHKYHELSRADIYFLLYVNGKFYRYIASQNPLWPPTEVQVEKSYPLPQLHTPASFKVSKRRTAAKGKGRAKEEGRINI
ncbi:hypothetical protein BR93DRAFT_935200 [Coniochaeta sp. PMI_546]|nr:hypothetical protein BR93DRAFT_935200 [Coniochaeta sp. PMI_546]